MKCNQFTDSYATKVNAFIKYNKCHCMNSEGIRWKEIKIDDIKNSGHHFRLKINKFDGKTVS